MIRVLIVEDQRMAREDMENYIQSSGRYCLAASITNAAMAETVCRQSRCELVLMSRICQGRNDGHAAGCRYLYGKIYTGKRKSLYYVS